MTGSGKIGVLFVCMGNICRSPMAEAVFRHLVRREGLEDRFEIDSAGTMGWHAGERPHHGTRKLLDRYGIAHDWIRARQVRSDDFLRFRYIVAMDSDNLETLRRMARSEGAVLLKLLDLTPDERVRDVPDPYYTGNFQEVYELVEKGCRALLERIRNDGLL